MERVPAEIVPADPERGLDAVDDDVAELQGLLPWQSYKGDIASNVPASKMDVSVDIKAELAGEFCAVYFSRAILQTVVAWLVFFGFFYISSTHIRAQYPWLMNHLITTVAVLFLFVLWLVVLLCFPKKAPALQLHFREMACWMTLSCVAGVLFGDYTFTNYLLPAYQQMDLQHRSGVNVMSMPSSSMSDTSQFYFIEGTHVDNARGMSFTGDKKTFCVAPITYKNSNLAEYDYWAVGTDCCRTQDPTFDRCGESADPHARAGYRFMLPQQMQYFKLAVEQSEAEYGITAGPNPVFVYWTRDPAAQADEALVRGLKTFLTGAIFVAPLLHVFIVVAWLINWCITYSALDEDDDEGLKAATSQRISQQNYQRMARS